MSSVNWRARVWRPAFPARIVSGQGSRGRRHRRRQGMPSGKQLAFAIDVAEDFTAPVDEGDLSEILGNLVEDAVRFAKSSVHVMHPQPPAR